MAWLDICGELRATTRSRNWEPMFVLYCRRLMNDDYRIGREINRVAAELNLVVTQREDFIGELDDLGTRHVPTKMAEFMREIQAKDKETVEHLRILEREMELNAQKKLAFIEKLNGNLPL